MVMNKMISKKNFMIVVTEGKISLFIINSVRFDGDDGSFVQIMQDEQVN
jgi:hypothetical protein